LNEHENARIILYSTSELSMLGQGVQFWLAWNVQLPGFRHSRDKCTPYTGTRGPRSPISHAL